MKLVDNYIYQVKDEHKDRVVNLNNKKCTCRMFDLNLLFYAHVYAVIRYLY